MHQWKPLNLEYLFHFRRLITGLSPLRTTPTSVAIGMWAGPILERWSIWRRIRSMTSSVERNAVRSAQGSGRSSDGEENLRNRLMTLEIFWVADVVWRLMDVEIIKLTRWVSENVRQV